jgi:hypothetical protein
MRRPVAMAKPKRDTVDSADPRVARRITEAGIMLPTVAKERELKLDPQVSDMSVDGK